MSDGVFDATVAATYDDDSAAMFEPEVLGPTVDVLAELAGGGDGRALELASGTGRVALPLRRRGVEVHGVELSQAMTDRLRAKPGGNEMPVTVGDMTATRVAARHLGPGGRFVIEVGVPALRLLPPGERFVVFRAEDDRLGIDEYDVVDQRFVSHHYRVGGKRTGSAHIPFRYVWPSELDLMARLAGMEPEHRWADWDRSPFDSGSQKHVSVWRKP